MSGDVVIRAEGLGKKYVIGHQAEHERYAALRDVIAGTVRGFARSTVDMVRGRSIVAGDTTEEFWALKDVSFEIKRGEVVGIIGRNGAGKSTLLKILSRITEPSEGRVTINGRVASLLEVGTGFHPELTGRENIYLNGAILGMSRAEIRKKFDEIVDFAGVEKFLDTPVKRYSSGMYVRLAFAVAAHLEPEILVVDEVLAVGDAAFQKKCLGKIGEVAGHGRTVLFVSHNMGAVRALCDRVLLLTGGRTEMIGHANEIVAKYLDSAFGRSGVNGRVSWSQDEAPGGESLRARELYIRGADSNRFGVASAEEPIEIACVYEQRERLCGARIVIEILTASGDIAFASTDHAARADRSSEPGRYKSVCYLPGGFLNRGTYFVRFRAGVPGVRTLIPETDGCCLYVDGASNHGSNFEENWPGAVCPRLEWNVERCSHDD